VREAARKLGEGLQKPPVGPNRHGLSEATINRAVIVSPHSFSYRTREVRSPDWHTSPGEFFSFDELKSQALAPVSVLPLRDRHTMALRIALPSGITIEASAGSGAVPASSARRMILTPGVVRAVLGATGGGTAGVGPPLTVSGGTSGAGLSGIELSKITTVPVASVITESESA
jgi:hypothetical protein